MEKKKKKKGVEESAEEYQSDNDSRDSDYVSLDDLFVNLFDDDDDDSLYNSDAIDFDVDRSVGDIRDKSKRKKTISLKKRKGVQLKIFGSKVTGKLKRVPIAGNKRSGPNPKIAKTLGAPGSSTKGTGRSRKGSSLNGKGKGLSREAR